MDRKDEQAMDRKDDCSPGAMIFLEEKQEQGQADGETGHWRSTGEWRRRALEAVHGRPSLAVARCGRLLLAVAAHRSRLLLELDAVGRSRARRRVLRARGRDPPAACRPAPVARRRLTCLPPPLACAAPPGASRRR
jgi:hypothetical protein